jgi:hypothetical protein
MRGDNLPTRGEYQQREEVGAVRVFLRGGVTDKWPLQFRCETVNVF